jgi:ABC-2 type transport system ATP-binding protein
MWVQKTYGVGKTTLLRLLAGLAAPTAGDAAVLGGTPRQDPAYLAEIGFLAQEIPLYRRLTAQDHIGIGAHLNPRWDGALVRDRLASLKIPLDRPAGTLSGGQRAQLARQRRPPAAVRAAAEGRRCCHSLAR